MFQKGLKGVIAVQTKIASVDGDRGVLKYRGQLVDEAIKRKTFEEAAYFLWYGTHPTNEQKKALERQLTAYRVLPPQVSAVAKLLPKENLIMDNLRTLVSAYSEPKFNELSPETQALALTAALPSMTALLYRFKHGWEPAEPRNDLGHTANFLWMLNGQQPSEAQTDALETYLKLTMEHGMNASTFAARVTVSTESDMVSAITSAIGTMKGPLHGELHPASLICWKKSKRRNALKRSLRKNWIAVKKSWALATGFTGRKIQDRLFSGRSA